MGASSLDYTLVYVPRLVDLASLRTPSWLVVRPFPDRDVNPLAWLLDKRGGMVLDLRVPVGFLSKRRMASGIVDPTDPEQRRAILWILEQLIAMTPNHWVLYGYWTGIDEELRHIEDMGPVDDAVLDGSENDILNRFSQCRD